MNRQPKPDSKKYTDLISEIQKGQIKIPKFQRDFVWSIEKTSKLLDSILKGYPIGTFILWETNERLNDIKNIGNLDLPPIPDDIKVQYVLDGQQRITSLYAAFLGASIQKEGEKKVTNYGLIFVDLEGDIDNNDEQIIVSEQPENTFITLNEVLNFNDNLFEIKERFSDEQFKKIHQYSQTFSTYDFSTVVLRKEDIDSAIEVFTRINTGGQTLTLFEIMSAKTYDEDQKIESSDRYTNPHTAYRNNLIKFVLETRAKEAIPVLFSSIVRRNFNEYGTLVDTHGEYPLETRLVALEFKVPFIDLQYLTEQLEESYGVEGSKKLHLHFEKGENLFYKDGKYDDTHLSILGATEVAKLAVKELIIKVSSLAEFTR